MKKYLLFAGIIYYPRGGVDDLRGNFDTIEEAIESAKQWSNVDNDWYHIVDRDTMRKVLTSDC